MDGLLIDFPLKLELKQELICRGVTTAGSEMLNKANGLQIAFVCQDPPGVLRKSMEVSQHRRSKME